MAVAFRAASSQVSFTGSTMVVTKPTGTVDDDLLFAVLYIESGTVTVTGVPARLDAHQQWLPGELHRAVSLLRLHEARLRGGGVLDVDPVGERLDALLGGARHSGPRRERHLHRRGRRHCRHGVEHDGVLPVRDDRRDERLHPGARRHVQLPDELERRADHHHRAARRVRHRRLRRHHVGDGRDGRADAQPRLRGRRHGVHHRDPAVQRPGSAADPGEPVGPDASARWDGPRQGADAAAPDPRASRRHRCQRGRERHQRHGARDSGRRHERPCRQPGQHDRDGDRRGRHHHLRRHRHEPHRPRDRGRGHQQPRRHGREHYRHRHGRRWDQQLRGDRHERRRGRDRDGRNKHPRVHAGQHGRRRHRRRRDQPRRGGAVQRGRDGNGGRRDDRPLRLPSRTPPGLPPAPAAQPRSRSFSPTQAGRRPPAAKPRPPRPARVRTSRTSPAPRLPPAEPRR
jgi:hypothetical protein